MLNEEGRCAATAVRWTKCKTSAFIFVSFQYQKKIAFPAGSFFSSNELICMQKSILFIELGGNNFLDSRVRIYCQQIKSMRLVSKEKWLER